MVVNMGMWGFWKRKTGRKQRSSEDASAEAEKTLQAARGAEETTSTAANEVKAQEDEGFCFDKEHHKPVIRSSICTGEQVAGFKDRRTGRFTEIMLVRNNEDIEEFTHKYGISREEITREW